MILFQSKELENPFIGVKWFPHKNKIYATTSAWNKLPEKIKIEALGSSTWDFLDIEGKKYVKRIIKSDENEEVFYLLPADEWNETLQKLEKVNQEYQQTREQLMGFVQNIPIPLVVVSNDNQNKVLFANKLLLDFFELPLAKLYQGLTLNDLFNEKVQEVLSFFESCLKTNQAVQETIELQLKAYTKKYLLLRIFPFKTSFMTGMILGILDLTNEKEKEQMLADAFAELQAQAEELVQAQDAVLALNEELKTTNQQLKLQNLELESSLLSAKRIQKKLLANYPTLDLLKDCYDVYLKLIPHSIVSGDFFFVLQGKGNLEHWNFFVFGDATGHGASASLLGLSVKNLIQNYLLTINTVEQLHRILEGTHSQLLELLETQNQIVSTEGAELVILALPNKNNPDKNHIYFSLAGRPLWLYSLDKTLQSFEPKNKAIGWFIEGNYIQNFITYDLFLKPGESIFLFSDGLVDQFGMNQKRFGKKRLLNTLKNSPNQLLTSQAKIEYILNEWNKFKSEQTLIDDTMLCCIQALP